MCNYIIIEDPTIYMFVSYMNLRHEDALAYPQRVIGGSILPIESSEFLRLHKYTVEELI